MYVAAGGVGEKLTRSSVGRSARQAVVGGNSRRTAAARLAKGKSGAEQIGLAGGTPADGSCSAGKKLSLLHLLPHSVSCWQSCDKDLVVRYTFRVLSLCDTPLH